MYYTHTLLLLLLSSPYSESTYTSGSLTGLGGVVLEVLYSNCLSDKPKHTRDIRSTGGMRGRRGQCDKIFRIVKKIYSVR